MLSPEIAEQVEKAELEDSVEAEALEKVELEEDPVVVEVQFFSEEMQGHIEGRLWCAQLCGI